MSLMNTILFIFFVFSHTKSESKNNVNIAFNKTAIQSSTYGFDAELAVDGNKATCAVTSRGDVHWFVVDLGIQYPIETIDLISSTTNVDRSLSTELKLLLMNDFEASSTPPSPSSAGEICREFTFPPANAKVSVRKEDESQTVYCKGDMYRYVSLWAEGPVQIVVYDIKVIDEESGNDIARDKEAYLSSTIKYMKDYVASFAVDGDESTFSYTGSLFTPSWLVVDLAGKYFIERIKVTGYYAVCYKEMKPVHILLMNNFEVSSNPPNPSVHEVCWKSDANDKIDVIGKKLEDGINVLSSGKDYYQYVSVWGSVSVRFRVTELEVYGEETVETVRTSTTTLKWTTMTTLTTKRKTTTDTRQISSATGLYPFFYLTTLACMLCQIK